MCLGDHEQAVSMAADFRQHRLKTFLPGGGKGQPLTNCSGGTAIDNKNPITVYIKSKNIVSGWAIGGFFIAEHAVII